MSHDDLLSAAVTEEGWRTARMLGWTLIAGAIIYSPVVALAMIFYGWHALEYFFPY